MSEDDEDALCAWCDRPLPDGEGRGRFGVIAYHLACWDARLRGERPRR